ncbi:LysR family transcriptional regulator [Bordetella bronchiseptica]|uniref:LysR family transcriptional regulator n=1 Tax=Bordetella bronchiseptica TaxID=518 RepID=UPI00028FE661|nr:LysR family transcriptional regulator [Bordetella bronchiseptica]AZW32294.1 LysR family transcriptional regulator [Bordetella bronchiseptica]QIX99878.1 LysR family transcriptional regulator [Bordetella bronchiseptica]CCN05908.1 putative LysR-family regulatory protein [Bordetella bronchiseptica Bbr77]CCN17716.1 putative LysR-family regulatory protein [Bordetella bronchiseptica MO211]
MTAPKIIDMQALRIFLAAAKDQNMSIAASKLGLTQSAVSQAIGQLEEQFGIKLLDRNRRPLTLTSAGYVLYERGEQLVSAALNLKGAVLEAGHGVRPAIRLGLVDSVATTCGTSIIKQLMPRVAQLKLQTGLSFDVGAALIDRRVDLAITSEPMHRENGLVRYRVLTEQFMVIFPPGLEVADRENTNLSLLSAQLPMIRYRSQSHLGRQAETVLRRADLEIPQFLEVDTADTLTSMVAGGLGWALTTPLCLLQAQEHAKRVGIGFLQSSGDSRSIYLLARGGEFDSLIKDTFDITVSVLKEECLARLAYIHPSLDRHAMMGEWPGIAGHSKTTGARRQPDISSEGIE